MRRKLLLIGASRGLGYAMAEEFLERGWNVVGLMAPGWVRTDLGGADARLSIEESVPNLVSTLLAARGKPGLRYLDYVGRAVPW